MCRQAAGLADRHKGWQEAPNVRPAQSATWLSMRNTNPCCRAFALA